MTKAQAQPPEGNASNEMMMFKFMARLKLNGSWTFAPAQFRPGCVIAKTINSKSQYMKRKMAR